jgi:hypothetical protein
MDLNFSKGNSMLLGIETGSLVNHVLASYAHVPKVGEGATEICWSDRLAGTVVGLGPHAVLWRRDIAKRTDTNGMSECQQYSYSPDPNAPIKTFVLTPKGYKSDTGSYLSIGYRNEYHDYSF